MTTSAHFVHTGATSRARIAEVRQFSTHRQALQAMSNGEPVAYSQTLRVVTHEGNREPSSEATVTRKHPGFIRCVAGAAAVCATDDCVRSGGLEESRVFFARR